MAAGGPSMVEEEQRFHGLPPLKRFKMLEKEKERVKHLRESDMGEVGGQIVLQQKIEGVKVLCRLPAKKRVCALQFFTHDEEEQQENKKTPLIGKKPSPPLLPRPLQSINLNRKLPISIAPVENVPAKGVTKKKKTMQSCSVVKDVAEVKLARERLQNEHSPVVAEKAPTEVNLVVKKNSMVSNALQYASDQQMPVVKDVILTGKKHQTDLKPAKRKGEANPAAINFASVNLPTSVVADGAHVPINLQTSSIDCGNSASIDRQVSANSMRALHHLKKTDVSSSTKLHPTHDQQVLAALEKLDKGLIFEQEEKCAHLEQNKESDGDDDGVFCDVCKEADAEPSDPIVFCDGCNVMVHASCYGSPLIDGIPDGDWFCRQCESESRRKKADEGGKGGHIGFHVGQRTCASRVCCFCPSRKGAMKQTTGGAWAHLSCALYVPEVFYRRARDREGIECGSVPTWRWELPCVVCSTRGQGSCIQCTEVGCSSTFHVSCALDAGLTIDYRNANALTKTPAIVIAFCPSHSRQALTHSERRRFKIVPRC